MALRSQNQVLASHWPSGHMIRSQPRIGRTAPDRVTGVEARTLDVGVPVGGRPVGFDGEGMVAGL